MHLGVAARILSARSSCRRAAGGSPPFLHAKYSQQCPGWMSWRRGFCAQPDPYQALGIGRDASEAEIKKAYKEKALKWHPDRNPEERREEAQKRFSETATAYEILSNPEKRQEYDTFGRVGGGAGMPPGSQGFPGAMHPADAERIFRQMFENEQMLQQFIQRQQQMQAMQQERMRQQQGLRTDVEVWIRRDSERIKQASRSSGIDSEFDERRARYAGKLGTVAKCDYRDQSIKVRVMVSPGRADELWYGADAVWMHAALEPGMEVRICADVGILHKASREASIGMDNDDRRERCVDKLGTITKVDLSDQSAKIRVLVGARSADELWFGFGAFEPIAQLPKAPMEKDDSNAAGPRGRSCGGGPGGPFSRGPFPAGSAGPFEASW